MPDDDVYDLERLEIDVFTIEDDGTIVESLTGMRGVATRTVVASLVDVA